MSPLLGGGCSVGKTRSKPFSKGMDGHVRLAGLEERKGKATVAVLAIRLGRVGSSPIVEGLKDLQDAHLMRHVDCCNFDPKP